MSIEELGSEVDGHLAKLLSVVPFNTSGATVAHEVDCRVPTGRVGLPDMTLTYCGPGDGFAAVQSGSGICCCGRAVTLG